MNCHNKRNDESKILIYEYIQLSKNSVSLEFNYNDDHYILEFNGKDNITSVNINKNFEHQKNIPPLLLDLENIESKYIINELKQSKIVNSDSALLDDINRIKIIYYIYAWRETLDGNITDSSSENDYDFIDVNNLDILNESKKCEYIIEPTEYLKNYLINTLLVKYYLPIYEVQDGDTISSICLKLFGNSNYETLLQFNHGLKLKNQYLIVKKNEKLRIPNIKEFE